MTIPLPLGGIKDPDIRFCFERLATAVDRRTFRVVHTWAVAGAIAVPVGDTDYIPPFFMSVGAGERANIVKARYRINGGTSVTAKLQKNGSDISGYTGLSITTTSAQTVSTQAVADNDLIALVVTAVAGAPMNLSVSLDMEHTIV